MRTYSFEHVLLRLIVRFVCLFIILKKGKTTATTYCTVLFRFVSFVFSLALS